MAKVEIMHSLICSCAFISLGECASEFSPVWLNVLFIPLAWKQAQLVVATEEPVVVVVIIRIMLTQTLLFQILFSKLVPFNVSDLFNVNSLLILQLKCSLGKYVIPEGVTNKWGFPSGIGAGSH